MPTKPPPDVSRGPMIVAVSSALLSLAFIVYLARMYTRIRPVFNLGWDDAAISLAMVGAFGVWGVNIISIAHGQGRHTIYVSPSDAMTVNYMNFINAPLWSWATVMIKVSVALSLLRIKKTRPWKLWMNFIIISQVTTAAACTITQLIRCRPIRASWDPSTPGAKCWNPQDGLIGLYVISVALAVSDVVLSCIPIIFIRTLHRPLSEKVMLVCLMGLGLFASAAAIPKIRNLKYYGEPNDPFWDIIDLSLWSFIEQDVGMVAACIPCMKSPIQRCLQRLGILSPNPGPGVVISSFARPADRSEFKEISLHDPKLGHAEDNRGATEQSDELMPSSNSYSEQLLADNQRPRTKKDTDATVSVVSVADPAPLGT